MVVQQEYHLANTQTLDQAALLFCGLVISLSTGTLTEAGTGTHDTTMPLSSLRKPERSSPLSPVTLVLRA